MSNISYWWKYVIDQLLVMVVEFSKDSTNNLSFEQVMGAAKQYGYEMRKERNKRSRFRNYAMSFQEGGQNIAMDKDLKLETLRVYLYAISCLDYGNEIIPTQTEIAEKLGMARSAVTRAFSILNKKEIFLKGDKRGKCTSYFLHPKYGWKGDGKDLDEFWEVHKEYLEGNEDSTDETPLAS